MIPARARNLLLPAFIGSVVLIFGLGLLTIVARGPYTHSNLNARYDPTYTRTQQSLVGPSIPLPGGMLAVTPAADPVEHGRQLFVANGCAACHGLDGRGGIIGPSLVGKTADRLRAVISNGRKGMPAFAPEAVSDSDLAAIIAFLDSMKDQP